MELLQRSGRGDLDGVKRLIEQRVYVNTTNSCKQSALYLACEKGYTEVAQYLLKSGASVDLGAKPLIAAVRNKHYDCVKLLLQHNAHVNCSNTKGESPMSIARQKRHYSTILLLLQYGAVPPASLGDEAIQMLKSARDDHTQAIEKLIKDKIINLTSESTFLAAFSFAFKRGSVELAERMLSSDSYSKTEQLYPEAAYYSAKNNWPTILSKLLAKGVDINLLTDGYTPLYVACKEGHEAVVTLLLNNGADPNVLNKHTAASKDFLSPLQVAVQRGNTEICDILLGKGAELNQHGEPLLHIACNGAAGEAVETRSVEQMLSMIRLLLQQGIDVNAVSDKGDTALYRACVSQQLEIVQILLEAGADVNHTSRGCYPVIAACEAGNSELINLLIKAGADVNCRKSNGEMCLHVIINAYSFIMSTGSHQHDDNVSKLDIQNAIKSLLVAGVNVNAVCSDGETALYRATKAGHEVIVQVLLEAAAETSGSTTRNPLHAACEQGYAEIVNLLLQHDVDCNVPVSMGFSVYRYTNPSSLPICCAVKKSHTDIIYMLLKSGADVNKQDQYGKSALIYFVELLASQRCSTSQVSSTLDKESLNMLKSMLLAGGDVNKLSSGRDGLNALHTASSFGTCDIMMELIQHGADCNYLTARGKSALDLACEKRHEAAVELLLKNGAKPDRENTGRNRSDYFSYISQESAKPVLCMSAMLGSETMVKMLLKHGADVNASDEKGNTALHLASSSAIIEMLLNAGADVNATNNNTETVLSVICEKRHHDEQHLDKPMVQCAFEKQQMDEKVIKMLLEFGADPNICHPLHSACKNNNVDAVQLLLAYGADANVAKESVCVNMLPFIVFGLYMPVKVKSSPLCIACKNGNTAIVDCLLSNGAAATFADNDGNSPLYLAVERLAEQAGLEDYDPIVTLLLQHNAAVNVVSDSGESPLYAACSRGLTGVVKQLLDSRADVGLTTTTSNKFPLMVACEKKFRDIAIMLLDRGADANVRQDEQTPLKLASANRDAVLVKQLLASGADVDDTALHAAVVRNEGLHNDASNRIVQMLLKNGAKANALNCSGETPLYLACRPTSSVNVDIVRTLLVHGADPNICPSSNSSSWSRNQVIPPLSAAALCSNSELIMLLIKFGARLDQTDDFHRTALHFATRTVDVWIEGRLQSSKTDTSAADILLSAGADANVMDKNGATPLYLACDRGMTEFVKLLLSHGASPNTGTDEKYPILAACNGQHYDSVKLLLEYNADVIVRGKNGKACLHHVLESHHRSHDDKRSDVALLLLDKSADMHTASDDGETPFYVACSNGLQSVVAKMLDCGAKANGNIGTKLPLVAACRNKRVSVVQLLLINGADPNIPEEGNAHRYHLTLPLHIAAAGEHIELVKLLLKHGAKVNVSDTGGNTALHHVLEHYHQHVVASSDAKSVLDILLENKADVNIANSSGETPLYRAASRQLPAVVSKMLQKYGGNPNKGSPLVAACLVRNEELVEILLKHGANPDMASTTCEQQKLPLFVALKGENSHIISLLLNAGANVNMVNDEGRNTVCFVAELLTTSGYYQSDEQMTKKLSTIHLLLQYGANFNMLLPDGHSPLYLVVAAIKEAQRRGYRKRLTLVVELLQLMVKHGAMLLDPVCLEDPDISHMQSLNSGTLKILSTFDNKQEFIVDLLRAGAGVQVIAACCDALATSTREAKSIRLCQAVVLTGYSPSTEELQNLQVAAAGETEAGGVLDQLLNWLNEDKQQVPSLFRQCRIAIRRQLSEAVHHQTIIPAIDELPLPNDLKLYLQFAGSMTEVDLSINKELLTAEETSVAERHQLLSPYNSEHSDYDFSDDEDYFNYYAYAYSDSDRDSYYNNSDGPDCWW